MTALFTPLKTAINIIRHQQQHAELLQGNELHVSLISLTNLQPLKQCFRIHVSHICCMCCCLDQVILCINSNLCNNIQIQHSNKHVLTYSIKITQIKQLMAKNSNTIAQIIQGPVQLQLVA